MISLQSNAVSKAGFDRIRLVEISGDDLTK